MHRKYGKAVIDSVMVESELLSPEEYLEMLDARPEMIEAARIAPAKLGGQSFGKILVRYARPYYRAAVQ